MPHSATIDVDGAVTRPVAPLRLPVSVGDGTIAAGAMSRSFVEHSSTSLLTSYLTLVRSMRHASRAPAVELRREDIDVLAAYLDESGEAILDRLASLMGATRVQRSAMAALFASGALVIGLVGAAAAVAPESGDAGSVRPSRGVTEVVVLQVPATVVSAATVPVDVPTTTSAVQLADTTDRPTVVDVIVPPAAVTETAAPLASATTPPQPQSQPQRSTPTSTSSAGAPIAAPAAQPIDDLIVGGGSLVVRDEPILGVADQQLALGSGSVDVGSPPVVDPPPIATDDTSPPVTSPAVTSPAVTSPAVTSPGGVGEPPIDQPPTPVIDPSTVNVGTPPVPTVPPPTTDGSSIPADDAPVVEPAVP